MTEGMALGWLASLADFLFGSRDDPETEALFAWIVAGARRPALFRELAIADTVDGRFDCLIAHLFLVFDRLGQDDEEDVRKVSQALMDRFAAELDRSMREMGVSDLRVAKKVRRALEAAMGRFRAYAEAMDADADGSGTGGALSAALARNVFRQEVPVGTEPDGSRLLAAWMERARASLASRSVDEVRRVAVPWPELPEAS